MVNLKFEEEPNYARYIAMFEPLCNTPETRPLVIDTALRAIVGALILSFEGQLARLPWSSFGRIALPENNRESQHQTAKVQAGQQRLLWCEVITHVHVMLALHPCLSHPLFARHVAQLLPDPPIPHGS